MKRASPLPSTFALAFVLAWAFVPAPGVAAQAVQLVGSALNQELAKIFPEIATGYIDLNGNGKADQNPDLSEAVAESRVKDGQLQAQEILDFVVANWRFIPLDRLRAVQATVKATPGAINELIALDFSASLDDAVRKKAAMGETLYLTPSANKEAMGKIAGIITAMATAYRKEGSKSEGEFVASRDALFAMIDKGYALPEDTPADERAILSTAMLNTAMKEQKTNPSKARSAVRALGRLGSADAAPYLTTLAEGSDLQADAIRAIGDIGYKPAVPALAKLVRSSSSPEVRKSALLALGAIGGADGLDAILDLLKPANRAALPKDFTASVAQALAGIAQKGNADTRVQTALKDLAASDDAQVRRAAVAGMGAFVTPAASDALLAILGADKDPAVRVQAVTALGKQKGDGIAPALMKALREKDIDPALKIAAINALGDMPAGGAQALGQIIESLADRNDGVRAAASAALVKLYPANQAALTGALSRSLLASQDDAFLVEGTGLLAVLADPTSVPALLSLLQKPQIDVRRNVAWAFYKIRSASNPRVVDELQKLITNETEAVSVRVNAIRAVGAIGYDSPQANLWQTLVTTVQMRGEKYTALRYHAVWALGRVGAGRAPAIAALARIATREGDVELRKQATSALRDMAVPDKGAIDALAASYPQTEDPELKLLIIEALADMGSDRPGSLAADLVAGKAPLALKRRLLSALAESPDEASATALLDSARDPQLQEFASALLEGYPASFMAALVARRLRAETDKGVITVLKGLDARLSQ